MPYIFHICVISLLYFTSAVTSEIPFGLNLNHLLLNLDSSKFDVSKVEEKWIVQPLDHFDHQETNTFKIKYFQNLNFWKPGGPTFIFIGGEWNLTSIWISDHTNMLITQMALDTNGAMFAIEHRYYGSSLPDIPNNYKIKYYKFLSSRQALADVANLITMLKTEPQYQSSPVVVVGGSYAGNLAAWMRELYPHLVDAAVASSAPVLAKKDFHEYSDVVRYTFAKYGTKNCLEHITNTFKGYEELLQNASGIETLKKKLNICPNNDLTVLENKQNLFVHLYEELRDAAQYGPTLKVKEICNVYKSLSNNTTPGNVYMFTHHTTDCLDVDFRTGDQNEDDDDNSIDAWTYQYCNEFGFLITTSAEKQPFVHWNPLEFILKFCEGYVEGDIEKTIDEGVAKTNAMFGGLNPNVSKVVFTHGDMDPWRALGVQRDLAPDAPAIIINRTAHCDVLINSFGPKGFKKARKFVIDYIKKWIS